MIDMIYHIMILNFKKVYIGPIPFYIFYSMPSKAFVAVVGPSADVTSEPQVLLNSYIYIYISWISKSSQVLLILWSTNTSMKYELVELFAGAGNVGKEWRPSFLYTLFLRLCNIHVINQPALHAGQLDEAWDSMIGTIPQMG